MKNTAFLQRVCLWLFALAVFVGAGVGVVSSVSAQPEDHLKCYQTRDANPADDKTVALLNRQFGQEECRLVTKARLLCAPTTKDNIDDPLGGPLPAQDYLCYQVKCPKRVKTTHQVRDQFGDRLAVVGDAQWLCTPAQKSDPLDCGQTAPLCNGACPPGQQCRQGATVPCFCQ